MINGALIDHYNHIMRCNGLLLNYFITVMFFISVLSILKKTMTPLSVMM